MFKYILLFLITLSIFACDEKPILWPNNNSKIEARFYRLSILDTSKIFTNQEGVFKVLDLSDSLTTKTDTVNYLAPDSKTIKYFSDFKIQTVKYYSSNPKVFEYYVFDHGAVKLVGFSTGDSLIPFSTFDNPLVIIPALSVKGDYSTAIKQNWSVIKNEFTKETQIKTQVKLVKTGTVINEGQKEEFMLFELILTGDSKVSFGEKELIVPDAIYLKSLLLFSKTKGLIYEWSIKTQQASTDSKNLNEPTKTNLYIELIKYNTHDN